MEEMISHERCSELLPAYVREGSAHAHAGAVEAHLAGCSDCSAEHRALMALVATEPPPLTEIERARLRRAVLEEAVPAPDVEAQPPASTTKARLFPLLGAAALVMLVAVFAYAGFGDGNGGGDAETPALEGADHDAMKDAGQGGGAGEASGNTTMESAAGASRAKAAPPRPEFKADIGAVNAKRLNKLGRSGVPLVLFPPSYTTDDVARLRDDYIEQMAADAPAARAAQLRECIAGVTSNFPTALPAYSAIGEFVDEPRREVLIAAFAWTDETEGPLDQSMVWAWPLGSCDSVAHYSKNVILPRG